MSKAKEIRDISIEEIDVKLDAQRKEIYELRSTRLDGKTQKTHLIREARRAVARMMTIKREKELKERS